MQLSRDYDRMMRQRERLLDGMDVGPDGTIHTPGRYQGKLSVLVFLDHRIRLDRPDHTVFDHEGDPVHVFKVTHTMRQVYPETAEADLVTYHLDENGTSRLGFWTSQDWEQRAQEILMSSPGDFELEASRLAPQRRM